MSTTGIVTQPGTPRLPSKYRILIYDTANNLVSIFTNVRAFDFIDSVNGGSAAGWFRISVDTTTLLTEDTGNNEVAQQYKKRYLGPLNKAIINVSYATATYTVTFPTATGQNTGQQIITVILDNYWQIAIKIWGPGTQTVAQLAATVAAAVNQYVLGIDGNPYTIAYTPGNNFFTVTGAGADPYTPPGSPPVNTGVQAISSYMLPQNLASAYQQAFQYNYRVQFFLEDSIDPWYDGRINGYTPQIPDTSADDAYITIYTEGWQNALNDGIVTETINPGLQPNGVNNGVIVSDAYLKHLLLTYQNPKLFRKPSISCGSVDLFQLQFQGEGLGQCVQDVVNQVVSDSGYTFEWWVRGLHSVGVGPENSIGVVVQPNSNPNNDKNGLTQTMRIAPTTYTVQRYFVYEVRGRTCFDYQVQNTIINLYNMIALYGGRDPTSQLQVYGPFEDSISIALYGVRQQRVTNDNLLAKEALENYAVAYLLLNAYPQPQTTYYKYTPTDAMRAGVWVQLLEPGDGTVIAQTLHQMRAIQVECQLQEDQEKMDQVVTAAAPRPFIDHAYYGAIQKSLNTVPVVIDRGGTVSPNQYIVSGGDWIGAHAAFPPIPVISPPLGHFGKAHLDTNGNVLTPDRLPYDISMSQSPSSPYYPDFPVPLVDSVSGKHGDGAYELDFVTNLAEFGATGGAGILVTAIGGPKSIGSPGTPSGNPGETPSSKDSLRLWQFVVLNGAIAGAVDMRTFRGQYAGAPDEAASIILTVPAGPSGKANVHIEAQAPASNAKDWYGGFQLGIVGQGGGVQTQLILWFAQKGEPKLNLNLPGNTYTPTIYTGDMSWFGSIGGVVNQIPMPDWAREYGWNTPAPNYSMMNKPRPISFVTQPFFTHVPKTPMGPMGSGSGQLRGTGPNRHGGIFQNYNFPGGQGALLTIFIPSIELPLYAKGNNTGESYLYYEMTLYVTCNNGNIIQTKRQFVLNNNGQGQVN